MKVSDLNKNEYKPYFETYVSKVPQMELINTLEYSKNKMLDVLKDISEEKLNYKYAKDKWSIKELLVHLMDTERIFCARSLRFARKDNTPLAGYDENEYAANSNCKHRTKESLINEYKTLRASTICLFESFTNEMLLEQGIASNSKISVRAMGFIISGHDLHHLAVLKERYLK